MSKRAFDLAASVVLLIILSPLMLLAVLAVLVSMGRPLRAEYLERYTPELARRLSETGKY